MSILKKPYEISVWDDIWDSEKGQFIEKRLGVIGADYMTTQARVIEPSLVRKVNGEKKLTFKLYCYYVDNETGERVRNPYVDWLISERKIRLDYDGHNYAFLIKDIAENSSN